jgi:glutamyl-tRNA synthetase
MNSPQSQIVVRFAPSPTGHLHVGNIRSAAMNWLFARRAKGTLILRLDDTDHVRSTQEFAESIQTDLNWLGLTFDRVERQSDRLDRYQAALETLAAQGLAYPCYETADELELKRKLALGRGRPPVYDRAALKLTDSDRAKLEAEGRKPHWRFKLSGAPVAWTDMIRGPVSIDGASLSDPVMVREDGRFLYLLASVVDDIDMGVTHVIRGEDHVTNSGIQIEMFKALGGTSPELGHFALLTGAGGEGLSKRHGALAIRDLRAEGIEAMTILSLIAKLGTSDPIAPFTDLDTLAADFDLGKLSRAPARFDPDALRALNAKVLHHMDYAQVRSRLEAQGIGGGEAFWEAVRGNLERLDEALDWWLVVAEPLQPVIQNPKLLAMAQALLPAGEIDENTWGPWTQAISATAGVKGKALFMPLRLALTGREHGPEMKKLLPLIGRAKLLSRLQGQAA